VVLLLRGHKQEVVLQEEDKENAADGEDDS